MPKRINIQTVGVDYDESDPDGFKLTIGAKKKKR